MHRFFFQNIFILLENCKISNNLYLKFYYYLELNISEQILNKVIIKKNEYVKVEESEKTTCLELFKN